MAEACLTGASGLIAPIFYRGDTAHLSRKERNGRLKAPEDELVLTGPSVQAERDRLPVRGDLAHIKLAGRYFVPHYAVPMPHKVRPAGASLRRAAAAEDEVGLLPAGSLFDVLEIAGGWAWGQVVTGQNEREGLVGYARMSELEPEQT